MPRDRQRHMSSPFCHDSQVPVLSASWPHQEALARLHFLVGERRSLGILTGGDGSGKSLVLATLLRELPPSERPGCMVNLAGLEPRDFLRELAARLHAQPQMGDDVSALWRRIGDHLRANFLLRLQTVVLLDDADEAEHEVPVFILRLLKSYSAGLTVVLGADPARVMRLGGDLLQLAQLRIHLEPWGPDEIKRYLQSRLAQASGDPRKFDDGAVARLYQLSNGVPRWVAHLAELSWLAAAGSRRKQIGAETVESAYEALSASYQAAPADRTARSA